MAKHFSLIAFDLDGTLLDTECLTVPDLVAFLNECYGIPMTLDRWFAPDGYHGKAGSALLAQLRNEFDIEIQARDFAIRRQARLPTLFERYGLETADGVDAVLAKLIEEKRTTCVVSNSSLERVTLSFRHSRPQIGGFFGDRLFSALDAGMRPKPDPISYQHAARTLGAPIERCVAVEDSVAGARAALAAGFETIGYTGLARNPGQLERDLQRVGVRTIITHWEEFAQALSGLEREQVYEPDHGRGMFMGRVLAAAAAR